MLSLASIGLTILFSYLVDMGIFKQSLFVYGVIVIFMIMAGIDFRKNNQNTMLYGESFKVTFLTAIIGMVISSVFTYVLMNFIDPGLIDVMVEKIVDSTESFMRSVGAPEEEIDKALNQMEGEMPKQFTLVGMLKNMVSLIIISAILAAIISIFLRREEKPA